MQFLAPNAFIDLRENRITSVNLAQYWVFSEHTKNAPLAHLQLSSNPLTCDCHAFELSQYANQQLPDAIYETLDIQMNGLFCNGPGELKNRRFNDILSMELTCAFTQNCPEKCGCSFRSADKALIVNCSSRGLTQVINWIKFFIKNKIIFFLRFLKNCRRLFDQIIRNWMWRTI